jgi:hypothetical protein
VDLPSERAPQRTPASLCFRKRLEDRFEDIFNELVRRAKELGAIRGEKVATDTTSVATNADPIEGLR